MGDGARRAAVVPVLMASITEVARLAGVSTATASRVVSSSDYPVSAATRERVLEAARTLDYVPNALARGLLKSRVPVVGVIVHDITDPYFAEVVRGRGGRRHDARVTSSSPAARSGKPSASAPTSDCCARSGRRRWCSPAAASTTPSSTRRSTATWRRCAPTARPSSTSRRTPSACPRSVSTTPPGSPRWSPRSHAWVIAGSRSSPDPRRCTWRASAWPAIAAGWSARASTSTNDSSSTPASIARVARWASTRCWPGACRSRPSAAPTTCWRWVRSSGSPSSGSTSRPMSRSPASTTSRSRR